MIDGRPESTPHVDQGMVVPCARRRPQWEKFRHSRALLSSRGSATSNKRVASGDGELGLLSIGLTSGDPWGTGGLGSMGVRLIVVDDHRLLAEALASALKLRGHRVLAAAAPAARAAELVITRAPEVCLIGTATPAEPGIFDEGQRLLRTLTRREVEVRVADGEDTRLIAAGMGIVPSTARTHIQRVVMKLGVGSRWEAAALAARTGLPDRADPMPHASPPETDE